MPNLTYFLTEDDVQEIICNRLARLHKIGLGTHVHKITKRDYFLGEGFWFIPVDSEALIKALTKAHFHHDDRSNLICRMAASQTSGEGYRESSTTASLHFQIAAGKCNVHLDHYGFVSRGPNGETYFTADSIQHIIDDLGWATLQKALRPLGHRMILDRLHPIVIANSRNNFNAAMGEQHKLDDLFKVGGKFTLMEKDNWDLAVDWKWEASLKRPISNPMLNLTIHGW